MTVAETIKGTLETIERRNAALNAFVKASSADALAQAERLDAQSSPRGLLHGMPIGVKDIIHVAGEVSGCGSLTRKGAPPETRDAVVVAKLREAGAVIPGKVNTVEYAFGGYGTNVTVGTPRNPGIRRCIACPADRRPDQAWRWAVGSCRAHSAPTRVDLCVSRRHCAAAWASRHRSAS
jgi:Asp-tRNA(Asn)/Glu-tRNA(Gln) amidotransferase A subunit family amidase